jgi:hypothetical protein
MLFENWTQANADQPIGIVRSSFLPQVDGAFEYSFESENGIKQQVYRLHIQPNLI